MAAMVSSKEGTIRPGEHVPTADERVVMYGIDWNGYETLLALRGERSQPRMAYLDGAVELMTTSRGHEWIKKRIAALLEAYLVELDIDFGAYGQWTMKKQKKKAGAEADDCYQLGRDQTERFPDIAIEVVWTHGGLDKLEIYRRLGVREVWYWIDDRITVHILTGDRYVEHDRSQLLPGVDIRLIESLLDLPLQSDAVKALRQRLAKL